MNKSNKISTVWGLVYPVPSAVEEGGREGERECPVKANSWPTIDGE